MSERVQEALASATLTLLRPLVRILLRNGIAYGSFAELARKMYVEVAFREFQIPGKKQTTSRVSALTGLTRKEVARLQDLRQEDQIGAAQRYNRAVRVISGWLNDPQYLDAEGAPADLPLEGESGSFATLVKQYSGDIPTQAMLSALQSAGSIEKFDGKIRLIRHAYVPGKDPIDKINILGTDTAELIATINHNLTAKTPDLRFQRKVSNDRVCSDSLPQFRMLSAEKAQTLLEDLDRWLSLHEVDCESDEADPERNQVSLGIYYFERRGSARETT